MEFVVQGAAGPVRLKNYHGCCKAKDASPHTMNNITAQGEHVVQCLDAVVEKQSTPRVCLSARCGGLKKRKEKTEL